MVSYLIKKLEEEYHHLSLWCFVSFFYGIIFFFKLDIANHKNSFSTTLAICLAISITLLCLVIFLRKREKFIFSLLVTILLFFILGMSTACFRIATTSTIPLTKTDIFDIEAKVIEIKPTLTGSQLLLTEITILNRENNNLKNHNRLLRKLALDEKMLGAHRAQDRSVLNIHEDLSTGATQHLPSGVEFPKRSGLHKVKVTLRGDSGLSLMKNDVISLRVKLFPLSAALLPNGYNFGLYMYLNGIEATGFSLDSPKVINTNSNYLYGKIQNIRTTIYKKLIKTLDSDEGNFVAAILLGETKALDKQMANNMRNSGIAHILSVSGLHLSLVAMIFFISARFLLNCSNYLSYKLNIKIASGIISILGSFAYLLLSGSNIAATRAFIMTFFVTLAIILDRSPYPVRSVMIAGMIILLFSPEYIMHPSFQLSFSAVLCLISGYELYIRNQKVFGRNKGLFSSLKLYIFGNIYSSFLGSVVTAPFVIYHFYKFATYSILMNLLAVPLMSFFMMPLAILSLILMPLNASELSLKLLGFFVRIIIDTSQSVITLPKSVINTGYITDFSMLIFTFGFFWLCLWQTTWRYFGLVIIFISVPMMYLSPKPNFIYDHRIKAIGIKNKDVIDIYSKYKMPNFTKEYWLSWYGIEKNSNFINNYGFRDKIFETKIDNASFTMSINYKNCSEANVQIMTSSNLVCNDSTNLIVPYENLIHSGIVLIFCEKNSCYTKFGSTPLWEIKSND